MIKSSNISIKFSNKEKLNQLQIFHDEYRKVVLLFIDLLWDRENIPSLIPKDITDQLKDKTWLSARAIQACAKQASGIVRGTKEKNKKRLFIYNKLNKNGEYKKARKLKAIIEKNPITKPDQDAVNPQLDSRFVSIDLDNKTSFDGWLTIASIGNKMKLQIPFKRTKHMNKMLESGWKIKEGGVRLNRNSFSLTFEKEETKKRIEGNTIGIDVGIKSVYSASSGQQSMNGIHGWNLGTIQEKICRKKKGSLGYLKAQRHRTNYIHWVLNGLNLEGVQKVKLEKIKNLRKGKKTSKFMNRWTYTEIFDKLEDKCLQSGVQIEYVNPTYTSQRCSVCGWTRKKNRDGILFKCDKCGFEANADLNASINISLTLPAISKEKRLKQENRKGFYWPESGKEPIVPFVQKAQMEEISSF
jgi:IS605 OrfB family transposase